MTKEWQIRPLGALCDFQRGLTYAKSDEVDVSNNVVLRATNIDLATNLLTFEELRYITDKVVVPDSKRVKKGSLMICTASGSKSHLGKVALIDDDYGYAFGGFMGMITPRNGLLPEYLFHLMTSGAYKEFISGLSDGTNINNLKFDDLAQFPVPIAPLPEQKRIVGILDEALKGIASARAHAEMNRLNAESLFEGHRHALFSKRGPGWTTTTVAELATNLDSKRVPITKAVRTSGQYPYFGASGIVDFVDDYIFDGDTLLVSEDGANLLMRATPIAFSVSGKYWVNNHAHVLQFENLVTQRCVEFYLESIKLDEFIRGAAQPKLTQKALNAIPIAIPISIEAQRALLSELEALQNETRDLKAVYERKVQALEALKSSLLHHAFTGQL